MALRQRLSIPVLAIRRYLRAFSNDYKFLTQLEKALNITDLDYRNLRRAISDYTSLDSKRKQFTTTRLLQALRAKLPGTDLQRQAQQFADKQNLELDDVVDAENTVPGSSMSANELSAYRLLVGSSNVRRAKIAVDMAKQGKSIPGPFVSAYLPIMTMIDDIAQGGYTFIRLLQTIHSRAKNKR
jgi:hypothetical protein